VDKRAGDGYHPMKIRAKAPDWFPYPGVEMDLEIERQDGMCFASTEGLRVMAFATSMEDAINGAWSHLKRSVRDFVECDESELSEGGLRYRNDLKKLLGM